MPAARPDETLSIRLPDELYARVGVAGGSIPGAGAAEWVRRALVIMPAAYALACEAATAAGARMPAIAQVRAQRGDPSLPVPGGKSLAAALPGGCNPAAAIAWVFDPANRQYVDQALADRARTRGIAVVRAPLPPACTTSICLSDQDASTPRPTTSNRNRLNWEKM